MKTAVLNKGKEDKYLNQYPLIEEEDIYRHDRLEEGDLFQLLTSKNSFIGVGYVGRQHKGLGWILSYEKDDEINQAFLSSYLNKL